ncbi:MAG: hypothetical protein WD556_02665 [Actinomycetota bacterium]
MEQVNTSHRIKIRYRILRHRQGPPIPFREDLVLWAIPDGLSPDLAPPGRYVPIEDVKRDQLLHERVMIYKGEDVTVADLIRHVAHVVGGVHAGVPKTDRESKLDELADQFVIQDMNPAVRSLRSIVMVVIEALRPLRAAITGERSA